MPRKTALRGVGEGFGLDLGCGIGGVDIVDFVGGGE